MSDADRRRYGKVSYRIPKAALSKSEEKRDRLGCYILIVSKSVDPKVAVRS